LGALDRKYVFGSMNRGGLPGAVFEMDDRFTAYTAESIVHFKLDGGKMLLRINLDDPGTANALESCARAVTQLAAENRVAMIEPFMSRHVDGRIQHDLTTDAVMRSMAISSALGATSSHTWLKVPVVEDMERVAEATTMPIVLLGGPRSDRPDEMFDHWEKTLRLPGVRGLVVGRNLLYPSDDDVATAVKTAVSLL
jgi:DhnA family fructose-bisphosphate aldolase class Ia